MIRRNRPVLALLAVLAVAVGAVLFNRIGNDRAEAARSLLIGLQDDRLAAADVDPAGRLSLIRGLNAEVVRVDLRWDLVATRRPAAARNPADPAYDWTHYDRVVDAARTAGVRILFTIWGTPVWASDTRIPDDGYPVFGRRPKRVQDAGDFAAAAATRYAPRGVHMWEAWNEPNIPLFLRPQYRRVSGRWVAESPRVYAAMLTSMYRGIHSVDRSAQVAGGVTAPAGEKDPQTCPVQPNCRITPRAFARALGVAGRRPPMDAYSHHPYPLRAPTDTNFAGASYVDLYNLSYLQRDIDATYLRGKPIWLTEFGIATRRVQQYPFFRTEAQQRDGLVDALRRVRANPRVRVFIWYLLQDHPNWASGLLTQGGARKPAAAVFREQARR